MGNSVTVRLLLAGAAIVPLFPADANPRAQIAAEISRIELAVKESAPPAGTQLAGLSSSVQSSLRASREALEAGNTYLALERLAQATDLFHGLEEVVTRTETVKKGLAEFEAEWGKVNLTVTSLSRDARSADLNRSPSVLRALSETSLARTLPLLDGGRGFAVATGPKDGLFYVGEARGEAEFARFVTSLRIPRNGRAWKPRSLLPELLALQSKADAAFRPPRSIDQHQRFIALNSTIKLAREMDASKSYSGALYQFLEAVRHYGMLDAPAIEAAEQAALRTSIASERKSLAASGRDDSIAQLFLERAAAQLSHPDGSAPSADEWRSVAVILKQVLPAYTAALKSIPSLQLAEGKTIDVTLVRWPYT